MNEENYAKIKDLISLDEVNSLLPKWHLLSTYTKCDNDSLPNDLTLHYVLGFTLNDYLNEKLSKGENPFPELS